LGDAVLKEPGTLNTRQFRSYNKVGRMKPVPHFVISREQQARMIRMVERGAKITLKLHLRTNYYTDPEYCTNIIAEIPGTDRELKDQLVLVGGHFDSNHGGTGAADNGAGSAVTMEVMRILKTLGIKPRRTIRLVLWGGEEQGHLGSLAYIDKYVGDIFTGEDRGELSRISVYFNHDNNGHKIRGILTQGNEPIRPIFERYLEPFHYVGAKTVVTENAGGTDHLGFDALNIPAFEWIQDPQQYFKTQIHTNMDVLDYMAEDTLKHNAAIIATFVYHAAMRDEMMPRKKAIER
jgi:Zn-dependent M28 family amino/carboxypeptidase